MRLSRRWLVGSVIVVIVLLALARFALERGRTTTDFKMLAPSPTPATPTPVHNVATNLEALTFTPPENYLLRREQPSALLGQQSVVYLSQGGGATRRLTVSLQQHTDSAAEYAAIRSRRQQPEVYTEQALTVADSEAYEFTNVSSQVFEKVLFIPRPGKIFSVAVTSTTAFGAEAAAKEYEELLQTLQWGE